MDYSSRISSLEGVINSLSNALQLDLSCVAPVAASAWNNSTSKEAYEEYATSMEEFLNETAKLYSDALQALRIQLRAVEYAKAADYHTHSANLSGKSFEERTEYFQTHAIDPSVRSMLKAKF
jgi:hypothetical protein